MFFMEIQIIVFVLALVQLGLPIFLTWRFCRRQFPSRWRMMIIYVTLLLFYSNLYFVSPWSFIGVYWSLLLPIQALFLTARVLYLWGITPALPFGQPRQGRAIILLWILFGAYQLRQNKYVMEGHFTAEPAVELGFPLNQVHYVIGQGGHHRVLNHHAGHLEQNHALDIMAVNGWGLQRNKFISPKNADFVIYGDVVMAPCTGEVQKAQDGEEDRPAWDLSVLNGKHDPYGNTVTLRCGGHLVYMAHLKKGSVRVRVGETIALGQPIALVGNSGHTTEPHLHIHALNEATRQSVPMRFQGKYLVRGHSVVRHY